MNFRMLSAILQFLFGCSIDGDRLCFSLCPFHLFRQRSPLESTQLTLMHKTDCPAG